MSFVGSGNVATHLAFAIKKVGIAIVEVFSEKPENAKRLAKEMDCSVAESLGKLKATDLIIIAVPDSKIKGVAGQLPENNSLVVHTSGITDIDSLSGRKRFGVFYPLQTFSKQRAVEMQEVPFCIEANNEEDCNLLMELASRLSNNVKRVSSEQRKVLHLAAVMVSNFSNHLYALANEILEKSNLEFEFLLPLIKETALKAIDVHPNEAQTGPARRNDISTLEEHLEILKDFPEFKETYKLLSDQIIKKYNE